MTALLITLFILFGVTAYLRLSLPTASLIMGAGLVAGSWLFSIHFALFLIMGAIYLGIVLPLNTPALRQQLVSRAIFKLFKKILPEMSQTEQEALESGTVWWEGELFSGMPNWKKLLDYPAPTLTKEEQDFLDGPVEELCAMLDDWHITHERNDLPPEVWQFIKDNGFFGMIIPKEHGGLQFSALAHSSVVMKVSTRSITAAVTIMVPNSLGPAELLMRYGTDAQRQHYLPRLAKGVDVPCFALTAPEAGSDAGAMPDTGIVCKGEFEGKEVTGIRLNWSKRYITLGPVATVLGLAFKLYDPEQLIGKKENIGITLALIPTDTQGVTIGNRHFPLNIPFMNGPNQGKDVFIPMEWIIGGESQVGKGWRMLMECLATGRSISLPSLSTGAGKMVCRATGAYSRVRKQFKTPIGRFEGVEEVLARMASYTYMMDGARTMTAGAVDLGEEPSVASAIVKYNLTERMRQIVNDAMDIQGGSAICMGPRNFLARGYQAIPISITVEGANILTRSMIIFGQGAVRCHPYVLEEMLATKDENPSHGLERFDQALFGHIGFAISNAIRSFWLGLTQARFVSSPGHRVSTHYFKQLTRMSAAFAFAADLAMLTLGGSLKRKEKLSGRLADMLSQLYLASSALKRFADQGNQKEDIPMLKWACEDNLYRTQEALDGLMKNLPNRPLALLLRLIVFPLGKPYSPPSDQLGHEVASILLHSSEIRDRLTQGMYQPTDSGQALGRLEDALNKMEATESIQKKIRSAIKGGQLQTGDPMQLIDDAKEKDIISHAEADQLQQAREAQLDAIQVDDFDPDYFKNKK